MQKHLKVIAKLYFEDLLMEGKREKVLGVLGTVGSMMSAAISKLSYDAYVKIADSLPRRPLDFANSTYHSTFHNTASTLVFQPYHVLSKVQVLAENYQDAAFLAGAVAVLLLGTGIGLLYDYRTKSEEQLLVENLK